MYYNLYKGFLCVYSDVIELRFIRNSKGGLLFHYESGVDAFVCSDWLRRMA